MRRRFFKMIHQKCRQGLYPSSSINRFPVPEDKVPWTEEYPDYQPVDYTSPALEGKPWADPKIEEPSFKPNWNSIDGKYERLIGEPLHDPNTVDEFSACSFSTDKVNRQSFMGDYVVNDNGYPLNPVGRTGIVGRGLLGRWGPNHAADPIVTRWKRNGTGALEINRETEKPILQFISIQRKDSGEWAIPGGMVDPGETITATLKREFMEEAMNSIEMTQEEKEELEDSIKRFFEKGDTIYKGYVDDPRNTDNAWMETVALNFHDEDGSTVGRLSLKAGDDASNVRWMDANRNLNLYANHAEFIKQTAHKRNAHW